MINSITYGSQNNCWLKNQPASPNAKYVGLFASQIQDGSITDKFALALKRRDRSYLQCIIDREHTGGRIVSECESMKQRGKKFELEAVSDEYEPFFEQLITEMTAQTPGQCKFHKYDRQYKISKNFFPEISG
jgi:DNA topoisomerase VI subunit A